MIFSDRQKTVDRDTIKSWLTRGEDGSYFLDREKGRGMGEADGL